MNRNFRRLHFTNLKLGFAYQIKLKLFSPRLLERDEFRRYRHQEFYKKTNKLYTATHSVTFTLLNVFI